MIQLTLTGFVQVFFVAVNTAFIARDYTFGVFVAAFLISYIWSINVKRVAFGTLPDRIAYSIGAALGSVAGMKSAQLILTLF